MVTPSNDFHECLDVVQVPRFQASARVSHWQAVRYSQPPPPLAWRAASPASGSRGFWRVGNSYLYPSGAFNGGSNLFDKATKCRRGSGRGWLSADGGATPRFATWGLGSTCRPGTTKEFIVLVNQTPCSEGVENFYDVQVPHVQASVSGVIVCQPELFLGLGIIGAGGGELELSTLCVSGFLGLFSRLHGRFGDGARSHVFIRSARDEGAGGACVLSCRGWETDRVRY